MNWFIDLLSPGNLSLASTLLLYSFVIFAGIYLGKIKITYSVSLIPTFFLEGNQAIIFKQRYRDFLLLDVYY